MGQHHLPVSRETWRATAERVLGALADEEFDRLATFADLLLEIAVPRGMVARGDAARIFERHVVDSARAGLEVTARDRVAVDVGSGAGLPGIPVAIVRPRLSVTLLEPRSARAAFTELAIERLRLPNVRVFAASVETFQAQADIVFTRAFAPLPQAWERCRELVRPGGRLVHFAGRDAPQAETPDGAASLEVREGAVLATSGPLIIIHR
jgi:16S rRNA (guanine527-N7)-methyltransferase